MEEFKVHGAPGTGKTTWIEASAGRCAEEFYGDQVSICSLTNAAVQEVASRNIAIPKKNLTTLHARCKRVLGAGAPAESFSKEFTDAHRGWKVAFDQEKIGGDLNIYEKLQILRQRMTPESQWSAPVKSFAEAWNGWCRETGRMDFTGWLEAVLETRSLPPQQIVFVDEAQDHTPLQLEVIRTWDTERLVMVGDADQSIFEWSGALPEAFSGNKGGKCKEKILEQSYRVPNAVHRVATQFIRRVKNREERPYKPRDAEGSVIKSGFNLDDIKCMSNLPPRLLENEDETYMIITSCAYMLDPLIDTLMRERIPFHNPYRKNHTRWNPLAGVGKCLESFKGKDRMWNGSEILDWINFLKPAETFLPRKKAPFLRLCESMGQIPMKMKDLKGHLQKECLDRLLKRDSNIIRDARDTKAWTYAIDTLSKGPVTPRLTVGTIHSVKGGESDNVILFPDLSPAGIREYLGAKRDSLYRLFYVGMTRARKNLILCDRSRSSGAIDWV